MLRKTVLFASLVLFLVGFVGLAGEEAPAKAPSCFNCGKCHKCAAAGGKCRGQDMTAMHVLAIKDGQALCCACGANCDKCKLNDDGTKCTCGKDVVKVSLKGKFVCEKCLTIADKAGKCGCGADLTEVK